MTDKPDQHKPGNDPKEVGREAEELSPNQETQDNRNNIAEDEMGVAGQANLDASPKQSRPLDRPEDNAQVDRVVFDTQAQTGAPKSRSYIISPRGLRNLFIASNVAGVLIIVVILTLASSAPQGRLTPADETQYQRTLLEATDTISTTAQNQGGQTARIPIDEAITLVAQKGIGPVTKALSAPATPAQGATQAQGSTQGSAQNSAQANAAPAQTGQAQTQAQPAQPQQNQAAQAQPANLDLSAGEAVFTANCVSCHQSTGKGVVGAFPPLAGHVPTLYNADRSYLINLLLYGLQGQVQIEGQPYNGVMPAWQQLSDQNIADVLNYVTHAWGNSDALQNFKPYQPSEIKSARGNSLSSDQVYALRQKLGLSGKN